MSTRHLQRFPAMGLALGLALAVPVQAGSLATSSAAGGSSASVGSSASSEVSSDSSSRRQRAAAGTYRIVDVAALADRPGQMRLQLQALAADAPEPVHVLVLPRAVVQQQGLAAGRTLSAQPQAYGTAYAHAVGQPAFYLVLDDAWQRELAAQPVQL